MKDINSRNFFNLFFYNSLIFVLISNAISGMVFIYCLPFRETTENWKFIFSLIGFSMFFLLLIILIVFKFLFRNR